MYNTYMSREIEILTKWTVSVSRKLALFLFVVSTICFWISERRLSSSIDKRCLKNRRGYMRWYTSENMEFKRTLIGLGNSR